MYTYRNIWLCAPKRPPTLSSRHVPARARTKQEHGRSSGMGGGRAGESRGEGRMGREQVQAQDGGEQGRGGYLPDRFPRQAVWASAVWNELAAYCQVGVLCGSSAVTALLGTQPQLLSQNCMGTGLRLQSHVRLHLGALPRPLHWQTFLLSAFIFVFQNPLSITHNKSTHHPS